MNAKKYICKCMYNLRLWLLAVLFIGMHGFIQGQNIVITYDNPNSSPGNVSSSTQPSGPTYTFNAPIPVSANNVTGKAYGGGGGGGKITGLAGHGGGGGGGGYIEKNFGNISGFASGQIGAGGKREENNEVGTSGSSSFITIGGITITAYGGGVGSNNSHGMGGGTAISSGTTDIFYSGSPGGTQGGGTGGAGGDSGGYPDYGGGKGAPIGTSVGQVGSNGYNPGGGGGGARAPIAGTTPGGHGGGGRVILSYNIDELSISVSESRCQGSTITFTASYGPGTNVTLQWYKDNLPISGATEKTYTITNAQTSSNGSYTVKATYNITYTNATSVSGTGLPVGLSISGATLSGTVTSPAVNISVNPLPVIPNQSVAICSGESVNFTPAAAPTGASYSWTVQTIYPAGSIVTGSGSGSSINVGKLTNTSTLDAQVVYNVTPTSAQGCTGKPFTFTVTVYSIPQITVPETICSGQSIQLLPVPGTSIGSYSSSDPTIAYIDANGILYTDVQLDGGIPEPRPPHSPDEGKGGTVTITFTTVNDCVATKEIFVTPRTKTPKPRWDFNGVCPINEGELSYSKADSANIMTPWNPGGVYFANHIVWDSLVVNNIEADIPLEAIKWYADEARTEFIRQGGSDPLSGSKPMANFWQNEPHPHEVYWATITSGDSCESRPIRVEVYIRETPEEIDIDDLIGYVQPSGTLAIDLSDYLKLGFDPSQHLEWYATEEDANNAVSEIGEPPALEPTQVMDITYWLVKADIYDCRSLPTPFRIRLVPMPEISLTSDKPLVCPRDPVAITLEIDEATAPYKFKIRNMNSGDINEQTDWMDETYTFTVNPLSTTAYRIIEFSDATTPLVLDSRLALRSHFSGYFDETVLSVVVTEITGINPASGPTAGGTYTADPSSPIDLTGTVTITGSGFAPSGAGTVSSVTFGGIAATNITVVDDNTITCTPPAHVSGYVTVAVTTDCATATFTDGYRYEPINIAEIEPAYAPVTGGTSIIIRGTGLLAIQGSENLVTVTLAGVSAKVESVTDTEIVCIADSSDFSLLGSIIINNGSEIREFPNSFTYYPVNFIEDGNWSEPHRWEKQTSDHILPYPGAVIQINANCVQDRNVDMDSITVHPSKAYTLNNNIILKANVFTLKEDASFLNYNGDNSNMQAFQQNVEYLLAKGRNWYISNPVSNPSGLTASSDRIEWYNESEHAWKPAANLNVGQGYTIYSASADMDVKFSGKYNDGDQTTSFILTRQNDEHEKRGFNLVGNPFPSYWHWTSDAAQQANLYSTIWYRTYVGGVYEFWSYNASGNVAVMPGWEDATPTGSYSLGYVPPMQAFWVRIPDGQSSGTLTFTDSRRAHSDHGSNMLKSSEATDKETRPLLRITANNGLSTDETVIYADPEAKKDFDNYDSDKWFVNQGVEIFTLPTFSTRELVINGLPEIVDGMEIPLGFRADKGGAFSLRAKEMLNLDAFNALLFDKWRNIKFDLRSGDYHFTSSSVSGTDRFCILFLRSATGGLDLSDSSDAYNLLAYADKNGQMNVVLHLRNQQGSHATVAVFDIAGYKLAEQSIVTGEHTILKSSFPKGLYIVRAGNQTAKVIVE